MARIWNEEELKSMPNVRQGDFGTWIHKRTDDSQHDYWIDPSMVGRSLDDIKEERPERAIADWMIATTDDKPHLGNSDYVAHFKGDDKPQTQNKMKTVTLSNGTILEVGKKYQVNNEMPFEIKFFGDSKMFLKDEEGVEFCASYNNRINITPYTAPQEDVQWKTFLIEFTHLLPPCRKLYQFKSIDDARKMITSSDVKITEVEIDIKPVNS